ncbi:MAG: carboxypeptidase-like regulatory domain-containing protein [Bacteroidota bacterium]
MKTFIVSIFLFVSFQSFSQTLIQGTVKDSKTKIPLSFCNIAIKGTTRGTLTNKDGVYQIVVNTAKDTLLFSYLGYNQMAIAASSLNSGKVIWLNPKDIVLQETIIYSDDDYLFKILEKCRKNLRSDNNESQSKAYFELETQIKNQPAELLECYYNGYLKGISIDELRLKNGRIGLAIIGSRVFNNWQSSLIISKLDLLNKNMYFPSIPFQYSTKEMKKTFNLEMVNSDKGTYHIKFTPVKDMHEHFSGDVWIDKQSLLLLKINLLNLDASIHPFVSTWDDSIRNVSLDIKQTFKQEGKVIFPELTQFDYSLMYISGSGKGRLSETILPDMARTINSSCVLYFYDYNKPFILPYFQYSNDLGDYSEISMIPYNNVFWDNNKALLLTENQKTKLGLISNDGYLINFKEGNYGQDFCKALFDSTKGYHTNYTFWTPNKRIFFIRGLKQTEPYSLEKINQSIQTDLYNLKVQLLLDVNQVNDTLDCKTYTVFDEAQTFFHLIKQPYTAVFLNIFFDICEIERRKMEKVFHSKHFNLSEVDSVYNESVKAMDKITWKYTNEVEVGKNEKMMKKWNQYVIDNLSIDNIKMFGIDYKQK